MENIKAKLRNSHDFEDENIFFRCQECGCIKKNVLDDKMQYIDCCGQSNYNAVYRLIEIELESTKLIDEISNLSTFFENVDENSTDKYTVRNVYLSEREIDCLGEFNGF